LGIGYWVLGIGYWVLGISYSKTDDEDYFIHKLYVNTEIHSKGIGRALYNYVFENIKPKTIRLTVNRKNFKAINFYFKLGFIIEKLIDIDIEHGFVMNDFYDDI
jgi:ribosomal protein S18 acetylase RimI-like enzyme